MDAKQELLIATLGEDIVLIKQLLKRGVSTNVMDSWGDTPLHIAAYHGYETVIRLLLDSDTLINARNEKGDTPLHLAAYNGHLAVVELLLENGAIVDTQNHCQNTPLHDAAYRGRQSIVALLLKNGAVTDNQNQSGDTPLHMAAYNGHLAAVALLLENRAIVDTQNQLHNTPLHEAAYKGHQAIIKLLLASGAQINYRNQRQATPLHLAASMNQEAVVELLLAQGALINIRNKQGKTPLHEAARENYKAMMQLLFKANGYSYTHKKADGLIEKHWENAAIHFDANQAFYIALLLAGVDAKDNRLPKALCATQGLLEAMVSTWFQPLGLPNESFYKLTPCILRALPRLIHWMSLISKAEEERAQEKNALKVKYNTLEDHLEGIKHFLLMTKAEAQQAKTPLYLDKSQKWVLSQLQSKHIPLEIMELIRKQLLTKVVADTLIRIYLLPHSVANYLAEVSLAYPAQCLAFYQCLQQHWLTLSEVSTVSDIATPSL